MECFSRSWSVSATLRASISSWQESGGYGRLLGVGASVFLAGAPFLVVAVAVRFAFRLAADGLDDYLAREFLELGQELTWAAIRNGIIFTAGGAAVVAAGAALARWSDSRRPQQPVLQRSSVST